MAAGQNEDTISVGSTTTTNTAGTELSLVPDRYGFLGGNQYSTGTIIDPKTVLKRERKWLKMLAQWNTVMFYSYEKVRGRCRKGIPMSIRPRAWLYLCGGKLLMDAHPTVYEDCLRARGNPKYIEEIRKDIHRQFPMHEMFNSCDKPGQMELYNVLKAYTVHNPRIGYCQAQAPIAAFLLMHMPAEQAFWCLVSVSDKYLEDYYSPTMEVIQRDGLILQELLKKLCPAAYKHLRKVGAEPMLYCTEWFLCAYTRTLPWDTLLRLWDVFLSEGVKILFKTALVILISCLGTSRRRKQCSGLCETLECLRRPPKHILHEEALIYNILKLDLTERDFQIEHQRQTLRLRTTTSTSNKPVQ